MHEIREEQPLRAAQTALLQHYAPTARVHRLRCSAGDTQVLELGTGKPLLLIHGGLGSSLEWVPIMPALAKHRRVLAVDRPGHGLADPFDYRGVDFLEHARTFVRDVLDALDIETADLAGNSLGGLSAAAFALAHPQRVSSIALVGAPMGYKRSGPLQLRLLVFPIIGPRLARVMLSNPTRDGNRKFWGEVLVAHPERVTDLMLDADVEHERRNLDSMVSLLRCVGGAGGLRRRLVLGERWNALDVPTTMIWGERDSFGPSAEGEAIAPQNRSIRVVSIPDAGHLPWFDDPDRVVSEMTRTFGQAEGDVRERRSG